MYVYEHDPQKIFTSIKSGVADRYEYSIKLHAWFSTVSNSCLITDGRFCTDPRKLLKNIELGNYIKGCRKTRDYRAFHESTFWEPLRMNVY